ncbi:vWA domain-containing protein [Pseudonocardia xinjiangensis]|uniref:vWA domain-containing protein n=1 Tax=Pseudonocardia xinjiangensis TaxID=75289 RepID=UPI003D8B4C10
MTKSTQIMLAALTVGLCLLVPVPGALAQEPPDQAELAPTMLVLDASGSMTGADPSGGTKMEAAKRAVHTLVDATPTGASVGLAAYGTSTGNSTAEREQGCRDVTVLREAGPIDKAALGAAVDGLTPRGFTPIGRALQVAAESLPQEGPRSIVLVSDGEDTCAPPQPCEVVRTLAGQGVDLVVHTVGFGVDSVARAQLSCVAQATGGTYSDAPDAETLQRVLPRVTATALRNYQPAGSPITGSPGYDTAPVALPGQYLDTIGQKEKRFYAVYVPQGATAYVSATVSYPPLRDVPRTDDNNALHLDVHGIDGSDCLKSEVAQSLRSSDGEALTVASTWNGATEVRNGSGDDRCQGGGRYYFAVEWHTVSVGVPERMPIELLVGVEPAAVDTGPVAVLPPAELVATTGPGTPVVGGGSFNVAGTLDASGTYTDALQRSEFVFYRVKLQWGQGLAYRVHFGETPGSGLANISPLSTTLYTPFREEIASERMVYTGKDFTLPTISTAPVRYNNRAADATTVRTQSVAGWYYIAVQVGPVADDARSAAPVPVRLDVSVTGTAEPGPRYDPASGDAAAGPFGENRSPAPAAPQEPVAAPVDTATHLAISPVGWIAAGAVLVAALVGGAFALRRLRRAGSDSSDHQPPRGQ